MCKSWDNETMQETQARLAREYEAIKAMTESLKEDRRHHENTDIL